MKFLIAASILLFPSAVFSQEVTQINVSKLCADIVGIPYASDNFSDEEWQQFQNCVKNIKHNYGVK